jgi:Protein of unknown function (DUF3102)
VPMDNQSNSLADLAARIKAEHQTINTALKNIVRHAILAGELLIEAKKQFTKHGEWLPWLSKYCSLTERTAQRYMRVARNKAVIESKSDMAVSDLTLNGALALLTDRRPAADIDRRLLEGVIESDSTSEEAEAALEGIAAREKRRPLIDEAMAIMDSVGELMRLRPELEAAGERALKEIISACEDYRCAVISDNVDQSFELAGRLRDHAVDFVQMIKAAA